MRRLFLSIPLLFAGSVAPAYAQCDTAFTLINRSGRTVNEFYFNPARNSSWGPDRLGDGVLANGRQRNYRPASGGSYDFRVVWEGGAEAEMRNVNICETSKIVATSGGIRAE